MVPGDDERGATTFVVRVWLAGQMGCQAAELRRVGPIERSADRTQRTTYRWGTQTGRISIGPTWRTLPGEDRRLVMAHWGESGSRATDIEPEALVLW